MKIYNQQNALRKRYAGNSAISIGKSGVFSLNKTLVDALNLKEGDKISVGNDENRVKDWFLVQQKQGDGFSLRKISNYRLGFNCSKASSEIFKTLKITGKTTINIPVSDTPEELPGGDKAYALITSKVINEAAI